MSRSLTIALPDLSATHAFAARLAGVLQAGDLVGLSGDLGAGKSELARAVLRARAGVEIEVPSPTFTLLQLYELPGLLIGHADLYRLTGADEILPLALDDVLAGGALLVEWPERAQGALPDQPLQLVLTETDDPGARSMIVIAPDRWTDRLPLLHP